MSSYYYYQNIVIYPGIGDHVNLSLFSFIVISYSVGKGLFSKAVSLLSYIIYPELSELMLLFWVVYSPSILYTFVYNVPMFVFYVNYSVSSDYKC